ncbi:MAG: chromate efflux transporter [Vicinamibacterales bacterium]
MPTVSLTDLAKLFLRLGCTAFGGPAAHIAMMRHEVVERRQWLTDKDFLDLLAATNLIPGPNSTEMAIHLGYKHGGKAGLIVAGTCFILPASLIVAAIAWAYVQYGDTPQLDWLMYGIGPVVIAIIVQALVKLGRSAITQIPHALLGTAVLVLALSGTNELLLLMIGAIIGFLMTTGRWVGMTAILTSMAAATQSIYLSAQTVTSEAVPFTLTRLTLFFAKVGSILFGSGYVLLAFLRADLTERWGWLTDQQLIDAVTIGQITPGPVFTTATFIGYVLGGWSGAVLATIAIFIPGFIFVAISQPLIPKLRNSRPLSGVLDGIVTASFGLMAAVTWQLAQTLFIDSHTAIIGLVTLLILITWKPNSTWLILAGATVGWLLRSV